MKVNGEAISVLNQKQAKEYDDWLMSPAVGYSIDQLMELAGLGVAQCIADCYPQSARILVCCGPGNNGGDGLVAARHLKKFGYTVAVWYPKPGKIELFDRLCRQLDHFQVPILRDGPDLLAYDIIVDALFGFGFEGPPREPFYTGLKHIKDCRRKIVSVDVPSGWGVDGDHTAADEIRIQPSVLVSLMLPKKCSLAFSGKHYLAGNFAPE